MSESPCRPTADTAYDTDVERAAASLRRDVSSDPSAVARIMSAVRQRPRPRRATEHRVRRKSWRALPLVAALLAGIALLGRPGHAPLVSQRSEQDTLRHAQPEPGGAPVAVAMAPAAAPPPQLVRFTIRAPHASHVMLLGDFNAWNAAATPMRRNTASGTWSVTIPLPAGRYLYAFMVDGAHWIADPNAALAPDDDFGLPSSVVVVSARTGPA